MKREAKNRGIRLYAKSVESIFEFANRSGDAQRPFACANFYEIKIISALFS